MPVLKDGSEMPELQFCGNTGWDEWFKEVISNVFHQYSMIIGYRITDLLRLLQGYDFRSRSARQKGVLHPVSRLGPSRMRTGDVFRLTARL
jgi:hypothetical protein